MPDSVTIEAQNWLREHEADLLADTQTMLRIDSVGTEPAPNAPFGPGCRAALDFGLELGRRWGMSTRDMDGYCGYVEFGQGESLVLVMGHLDVVPVGSGWKHEPFGAEIDGDYLYARGATDDKGPTMAALYACRALQLAWQDVPVRVRVFLGCSEETGGFPCLQHYLANEQHPTYGVAPDSGWPLYHAEKGICNLYVRAKRIEGPFALLSIEGGSRPNIVIEKATARVKVDPSVRPEVEAKLADAWDRNVTWHWNADELVVEAIGKAAHGAAPYLGDNAAIRAMRFLMEIAPLEAKPAYEGWFEMGHIGGMGLGIAGSDEPSGALTSNLGVLVTEGDEVEFTFNIRYPVTWEFADIQARVEAALPEGARLARFGDSKGLYFPLEHPLVQHICEAYTEETGESPKPGVMGGGTYARMAPNSVSIGTGWAGDGPAHEHDERLKVEHLYKMSRIYANILTRLVRLAAA